MKNSINLILQGKGGVGKSFISSILSQYFLDYKNINISGIDTDPVNNSFSSIKRINASQVEILKNGTIFQSKFDIIFENIINENSKTFIIDSGASTFVPLMKYIYDNDVISIFDDLENHAFIHTVIVGGQAQADTLQGLMSLYELISQSKKTKLVIWFNEFQGEIDISEDYKKLVDDKTAGYIKIINRNSDAFRDDLEKMTKLRLTNIEVQESSEFSLMSKNRIKKVFTEIYEQLDDIYE